VSGVEVRPLTGADRTAWDVLWDGYLAFYAEQVLPDVTEVVFQRLTDAGWPAQRGFLALRDGRAVGFAHVGVQPSTWAVESDGYLEDLYVDPAARGTGAGRALLDHLHEVGTESGWRRVHWLTDTDNTNARRLYDRAGELRHEVRYVLPLPTGDDDQRASGDDHQRASGDDHQRASGDDVA
jgi:GNAT superfamily N-acetyltransferase